MDNTDCGRRMVCSLYNPKEPNQLHQILLYEAVFDTYGLSRTTSPATGVVPNDEGVKICSCRH